MNPHDYILSVNENGEPYLEHTLFGKGGQKKDHKYYARAQDKGRWRYFYSPEEFRAWSSGGTKKKVSTSDKMRSAFKQIKETGRKAAETAADKLGVDERRAAQEAWSQVPKQVNSSDKKAMKALKKATAADNEYFKTPLGKAESFKDRLEEDARGLVSDVADKVKTKSERMREEFRKKASQAANDAKEKVKEKAETERMREEFRKKASQAANDAKEKVKEKAETERQEKLANRPTAHEKPEATGTAKEGAIKPRSISQIYEENAAKMLEQQRSNDKKDAQRASAMVDHYFAEMTKLTDRYTMMYGDNWESRISSKEREALQKSIDELDRHQKNADAKWDSYSRKWASTK